MTIIELILIAAFAAWVALELFIINHPNVRRRCLIGKHKYGYSYEKHGMYTDREGKIVGTQRRIYTCSCGHEKPMEDKDWIDGNN